VLYHCLSRFHIYTCARQAPPAKSNLRVNSVTRAFRPQVFAVSDLTSSSDASLTLTVRGMDDDASSCSAESVTSQPGVAPTVNTPSSKASTPKQGSHEVLVAPLGAQEVFNVSVDQLLQSVPGCHRTTCYLETKLTAQSNDPGHTVYTSEAVTFLAQLKEMVLADPVIQFSDFRAVSPTKVAFTVSSQRVAPHTVWESRLAGTFSDNGLTVHPCSPKTIVFTSRGDAVAPKELQRSLSVGTLYEHSAK